MIQTGVRVSELVGLRVGDIHLGIGPHIKVTGKGRKKRATPLTKETVATQRRWLTERRGDPDDPLFPTRPGRPLSRYTVGLLVTKHANTASVTCPSLTAKRVTPHVLRHTNAMLLTGQGRRHRHNRFVARSREHPDHPYLRARRRRAQGTSDRPDRTARRQTRPIPTLGHASRLPRNPLIMLSSSPAETPPTKHIHARRGPPQHNRGRDIQPVMLRFT